MTGEAPSPTTIDHFLGGRLEIEQPASGRHRAGLDALLLAATVPETASGRLVDLGAGVGTAGLAAALRAPDLAVRLAERDAEALRLAAANIRRNRLETRASVVEVDLLGRAGPREAVLPRETAEHVILNPPFWRAGAVRRSPRPARAAAHVLDAGGLEDWARVAAATLAPHGRLSLIFRGDGLDEILAALAGRFGAISIRPIHPRDGEPAHRLLVTAIKGSRASALILPGLVLHPPASHAYLPTAEAILRGEIGLVADRGDLSGKR